MTLDLHKNFAYSTVATAPSPATSGTSLVVASGDGSKFPTVPFNAVIWPASSQPTTANAEAVRVTARSTDTLTITRTQESTSARSVVVGDQIAANITNKTLTDIEAYLFQGINVAVMQDEFFAVNGSTLGQLSWVQSLNSGSITDIAAIAGHPGIQRVSTSTTSGSSADVYLKNANITTNGLLVASENFDTTLIFKLPTVDTSTDFLFGLDNDPTQFGVNGYYLSARLWSVPETTFQYVSNNAGTETKTNSTVTPGAGTWYRARIRRIDSTHIGFSLNGTETSISDTVVSTSVLTPFVMIRTGTTTARSLDLDYFNLKFESLSR